MSKTYKIVGYRECSGTLDSGKPWSNIKIYVVVKSSLPNLQGYSTAVLKARSDYPISDVDFSKDYNIFFDEYGVVQFHQPINVK